MFKNLKIQPLLYASGFLLFTFLTGCNDRHEDKSEKTQTSVQSIKTAPKIEIVKNENAQEIKVQEKAYDKNQSKSYYYDYDTKKKAEENDEEAKPRTNLDANMHVRSPYEKVQISMLVGKLSKDFIVKCSACHNDYANGIIGPSLLGRDADYIYNKIQQFKSGEKKNALMHDLVKMLSDKEIKKLANEIYTFNQKIKHIRK
ncbi:hypothetical protein [Sulfurimonas sp. HSL-1716]|uniref:c-type cytochrome n=1 Tax=Hydrocurvibacter sulfurireducens TaxID=3131937 RepID=UPI0031F7933D